MNKVLTVAIGAALVAVGGLSTMAAAQGDVHPAHIHSGLCPAPGDVVAPLTDVAGAAGDAAGAASAVAAGSSTTVVKLALADILAADHAIVVHHSPDDMKTYVACGDLGGALNADGDLAVALSPVGVSGTSGVAVLHDGGDGSTTVHLYVVDAPAAAPEAVTVPVTLADFTVTAEPVAVKVGQPVTFAVGNQGPSVHELVLEPAGTVDEPLSQADGTAAEIEDIEAGGAGQLTYTFTTPGTYQLACHIEGHFEQGMVTTFEVTG